MCNHSTFLLKIHWCILLRFIQQNCNKINLSVVPVYYFNFFIRFAPPLLFFTLIKINYIAQMNTLCS